MNNVILSSLLKLQNKMFMKQSLKFEEFSVEIKIFTDKAPHVS